MNELTKGTAFTEAKGYVSLIVLIEQTHVRGHRHEQEHYQAQEYDHEHE